ncbi:hypothetical protein CBR_g36857 [Chara braunii]|uniref:26S proteasome non-ATPase regulatory subunit 4 homolog n=1 Tax=Chara braunii TaxID=69332 RepID=A0A388LM03_CHABU|nr:hypothetical protein CBR_g36857 [Chara braunii]|eukprot:GBG83242.1 hypothetical protein CBR_g36857 [Chara braunii]
MVLEATMVCIDNSEWMRNGDYAPTRFQAQADAVNLICGAKTQSNPENTVGLLTMAGKGVRVVVTPTPDLGKILSSMHGMGIEGEVNLSSGVQVAQLALKHRQNKNQRQRIVLFAGSPVTCELDMLVKIGKKLKKNNVAVDVISFGDEDGRKAEKLEALVAAVNSNDNSHLVTIPPGTNILSDMLMSSPIFTGDGASSSGYAPQPGAGGLGPGRFDFGVDPNLDPELALALRVSMEEERARQEAAAAKAAEEAKQKAEEGSASGVREEVMPDTAAGPESAAHGGGPEPMDDESALLQQALAMSMTEAAMSGAGIGTGTGGVMDTRMGEAGGDDAELALALRMSMQEDSGAPGMPSERGTASAEGMGQVLGDAGFVNSVLASLPGVDPDDPAVRDVLASLQQTDRKLDKEEEEEEEEEEKK